MATLTNETVAMLKKSRPTVSTDHPLSNGYSLYLLTDHPLAVGDTPLSTDQLLLCMGEQQTSEALHVVWDDLRIAVIFVRNAKSDKGHDLPIGRLIELVVHEASHFVDGLFTRCQLAQVDTELRAYYLDWIVGKILHHFPTLWSLGEPKPQLTKMAF